mgnify:CR=1 FL=1
MEKHENVRKSVISVRQQQEFNGVVLKALKSVFEEITPGVTQGWIENSESLERVLKSVLLPHRVANNYTVDNYPDHFDHCRS